MRDDFDFTKMHGAGNDFIMIDDSAAEFDISGSIIASLCAFHTGIGADGLILLRPSGKADFTMRYFNRDGSEAGMCGNGARCAAMFAFSKGIAGEEMVFETGSGLVQGRILEDGVRIGISGVSGLRTGIALPGSGLEVAYAKCGVPHAVLIAENVRDIPRDDFLRTAVSVRRDPCFLPEGVNFNMVSIHGKDRIAYRTYERGVEDETLACGTGAVSIAVITARMGYTSSPVTCETSGGDRLVVEFTPTEDGAERCFLKGPAAVVFQGQFRLSDFASAKP